MTITTLKKTLLVAMLSCIAMHAFAEDAPVYDVDSSPPQFDGRATDDGGSGPTPPPARQEQPPAETPLAREDSNSSSALPPAPPPSDQTDMPAAAPLSMDQRVARLEQQINNSLHSDLSSKVTDLQTEIQALRGQVEDLTHQIEQIQTQAQQKADLHNHDTASASTDSSDDTVDASPLPKSKKSKIKTVSADDTQNPDQGGLPTSTTTTASAASTDSAAGAAATADQPNVAEEQQIYQTAYSLIKAKKYNDAAVTLQKMLQKYPSGQFAANAHYWLGELYGLMGKNDQSIAEFSSVVKNYPDSPKIADAQLKLGLIYAAQLKWPDAKNAFKKVINHYPGTSSAHLASEQLKQIKQAGH